jgi:hypothetical protein
MAVLNPRQERDGRADRGRGGVGRVSILVMQRTAQIYSTEQRPNRDNSESDTF